MQLLNTIKKIWQAESVGLGEGLLRHFFWQWRRLFHRFPVELGFSRSSIMVHYHSGTAALINCLKVYDHNNMNLLQETLHRCPGAVFFDVGANIGVYTLIASEVSDARVYAFEPHPEAFRELSANIALNRRPNVTLQQVAVSDHEGEGFLAEGADLSLNRLESKPVDGGAYIPVTLRTLDCFCAENDLWPLIVKIDVEGHEGEVIRGFSDGVERAVLCLVEDGQREPIKQALNSRGLSGPYFCHFAAKRFSRSPQRRREDEVFINLDRWRECPLADRFQIE